MLKKITKKLSYILIGLIFVLYGAVSFAAEGAPGTKEQGLAAIFDNLSESFPGFTALIFQLSIIVGLCFAVAAIFKFKQHKDNPAQVTVGQPIGLLLLAGAVMWLPFVIQTIGASLTGKSSTDNLKQGMSVIDEKQDSDSGFGQYLY